MTTAWVVGSGGLLGSALMNVLKCKKTNFFTPVEHFRWTYEPELLIQLEKAVKTFAALVSTDNEWQIYWAAGLGTMGSTEAELAAETRVLSKLLSLIESQPELVKTNGCFIFASSAGAIYAGSTADIINENTPIAPTTAYANEKLKQESLICAFTNRNCRLTVLLARISTLYGPNQAAGKQQGLIAEIARRILRNQSIQIFVPLDTIRDYLAAGDAAIAISSTLSAINGKPGVYTKIIASEQPTTIAEIISLYKRITRRSPRIITSASKLSSLYKQRMQFRSIAVSPKEEIPKTSLIVGISQVMASERSGYIRPENKIY